MLAFCLFLASYTVCITLITVCYHRGLCHSALKMAPNFERFVFRWGFWITGMDPAIWVCNHRMHHLHADDEKDPHSPWVYPGLWGFFAAHMRMYSRTYLLLRSEDPEATRMVADLSRGMNPMMYLPTLPGYRISVGNVIVYFVHLLAYGCVYLISGRWEYSLALAIGFLGHPVQGMLVNYFGHKWGYRNFDTPDRSTNHSVVALLIFGEGYQNNHHASPSRVNFAHRAGEFDLGNSMCQVLRKLNWLNY